MINPGLTAKVKSERFKVDAGPTIYCPKCKKPLMEAEIKKVFMRCKHCGYWVFLKKT